MDLGASISHLEPAAAAPSCAPAAEAWSCCSASSPCAAGGGDCDGDSDCAGELACGTDNPPPGYTGDPSMDVCYGQLGYQINVLTYNMVYMIRYSR